MEAVPGRRSQAKQAQDEATRRKADLGHGLGQTAVWFLGTHGHDQSEIE